MSRKTQGNLNFCRKNLENSEQMKCDMIANSIAFHLIFLSSVAQRNIENALETSGNLVSQKCGHFEFKIYIKTIIICFGKYLSFAILRKSMLKNVGGTTKIYVN